MVGSECKYPGITVKLVGQNGNAFSILGLVIRELRRNRVPQAEILQFQRDAMSGDYDNLLRVCMSWVNVK